MNVNKKFPLYVSLLCLYFILVQLNPVVLKNIASEDGLIESLGAVAFLFTAIIFLYLFFKSTNGPNIFFGKSTNRNIYFGLLGLLFFLGFGEEISWGQRIFGWETPETMMALNAQEETNIHNLQIFHNKNEDGTEKSFLELLLNMNRLFIIFWLSFCVLVPILHKYVKLARKYIEFLGIPLVPLWIGGLFLFNFILQQHYKQIIQQFDTTTLVPKYLSETMESVCALLFLLVAIHFFNLIFKNSTNNFLKWPLVIRENA